MKFTGTPQTESSSKGLNKPYLFMMVLQLLYLVATAFFEEGVAFFDPIYTTLMSDIEFYLTFSGCVLLFFTVVILAKKFFGIKCNLVYLFIFSLLLLSGIVGLFTCPTYIAGVGVYKVTYESRVRFMFFWVAACMAFYVFFAIMPKTVVNNKQWDFYFWGGIVVALVAIIFSYVTEFEKYEALFSPSTYLPYFKAPVSFTNNRNTYATLLFIGIASAFILFSRTNHWYLPLFGIFFYLNLLMLISRNGFLCSTLFLFCFFVWHFFKTVRSHPVRESIFCFLFCAAIIAIISLKPAGFVSKSPLLSNFYSYLDEIFNLSSGFSTNTLKERAQIWNFVFLISQKNKSVLFFGVGDWNLSWCLGAAYDGKPGTIESAHSGLVDVFGRLGLIGLAIYLFLILLFFVAIIDNYKHKRFGTTPQLILFVCVLVHGLFEDTNFLNMQTKDMMLLFITYMPVLTNWYFDMNKENESAFIRSYSDSFLHANIRVKLSGIDLAKKWLFITIIPFSIIFGLSYFFDVWNAFPLFDLPSFRICVTSLWVFIPFLIHNFRSYKDRGFCSKLEILVPFTIVYSILAILCSCLFNNVLLSCLVSFAGLLLTLISFAGVPRNDIKKLLRTTIFYFALATFLIVVSQTISHTLLNTNERFQPYAAMCLIILDFLIPTFVFVCTTLWSSTLSPFDFIFAKIETMFFINLMKHEIRNERRLMKAAMKRIPLRKCD